MACSDYSHCAIAAKGLGKLVGRLSKVRYKELEAEFRETLKQIEATSEQTAPEPDSDEFDDWNPELRDRKKELYGLARVSPRAAIMEAWLNLESQVRRSAGYANIDATGDVATLVVRIGDKLARVPKSMAARIRELRKLRNVVVHEPGLNLPASQVMEYVQIAAHLAATLDGVTNPAYSHHFVNG